MQGIQVEESLVSLTAVGRARRDTVRRALADAQRRLGRLALSQAAPARGPWGGGLVPEDKQAFARLLALKIRDLSLELESGSA